MTVVFPRRCLVSLALLLDLLLRGALAQNLTCTSDDLNAYIQCVEDNPCLCSNCDPDPVDEDPEIVLDRPPVSCQDVSKVFCPLIRCCSACEEEAAAWYACNFQGFSFSTLGTDCPRNCPGYPYLDKEGDCSPTTEPTTGPSAEPTTAPSVCEDEIGNYTECIQDNQDSDTCDNDCEFSPSEIDANNLQDTCGNQDIFCPLLQCCPDCENEVESLAECVREERLDTSDNDDCSLLCDALSTNSSVIEPPFIPTQTPPSLSPVASQPQVQSPTPTSAASKTLVCGRTITFMAMFGPVIAWLLD